MSLGEAPFEVPSETPSRPRRDVVIIPDLEDQGAIDLTAFIDGADGQSSESTRGLNVRVSALRRYRQIGAVLIVVDVLCLMLALLAAHAVRFHFIPDQDYI